RRRLKESGSVPQPFIARRHKEISHFLANLFRLPCSGVLIQAIVPDSPAEAAGLMEHDLIIYFDGIRTPDRDTFVEALLSRRPGDVVTITVFRDGETVEITLILGAMRH
ncbi:MAG: PDZ domain-containing protein, partial [Defluviitaleaceae bacterium]|nr:PDZ domain-containing protein [Defluviitaleaceae bacterium]